MLLFPLARVWTVLGHVAALSFTFGIVALVLFFSQDPVMAVQLVKINPTIPSLYMPIIVISICGCIGHVILLVHALVPMIKIFRKSRTQIGPQAAIIVVPTSIGSTPHRRKSFYASWQHKRKRVRYWWTHNHPEITRVCMLWEIALQTFQANKMSHLIATKWINRLVTGVIVMNCWFSPLLHYFLRAQPPGFVRLCRLLVDSSLDVAYSMCIPLAIFYPYYRDYIGGITTYPTTYYVMDTWYISAISELRQVFITSWIDLISKFTGALGLQHRLYSILNAVEEAEHEHDHIKSLKGMAPIIPPVKSQVTRFLDAILLIWGAAVLTLHVQVAITSYMKHTVGCWIEMQPWGSTQYNCAALEVSCPQWHMVGSRDQLHDVIHLVNPSYVQILILSNCQALEMPSTLQYLDGLLLMKVYNSTILAWGEDAALTRTHHPLIQNLYFTRVTMNPMPPGLLLTNFPPTFWGIMFCFGNVTNFPDKIIEAWTGVILMGIEGNPTLDAIPTSLLRLPRLLMARLAYNNIHTISDHAFGRSALEFFDMSGNPLTELPDNVGVLEANQIFDIRSTRVHHLPSSWYQLQPSQPKASPMILFAGNSPLCLDENITKTASALWFIVDCTPLPDGPIVYGYPIQDEDKWRRVNQ